MKIEEEDALVSSLLADPHKLREYVRAKEVVPEIAQPTREEIAEYRDTFRGELSKRMDTKHPSASPSTESHEIALRRFVDARNAKRKLNGPPITDNDRRWRFLEHGCRWVSWEPIDGERCSYDPRAVTTAQGVGLLAMRESADVGAARHLSILKREIELARR